MPAENIAKYCHATYLLVALSHAILQRLAELDRACSVPKDETIDDHIWQAVQTDTGSAERTDFPTLCLQAGTLKGTD